MDSVRRFTMILVMGAGLAGFVVSPAFGATNTATDDPGGGGFTLPDSGTVTVTASTLALVKQVYVDGTCMASSVADGGADSCNSNATSVVVPSGTVVKFLIYVRNNTDVQISDVRIQDNLDDTAGTGFTYVSTSIKTDATQLAAAAAADIFSNVDDNTAHVDADDADVASIDTTASPDELTVGDVATTTNQAAVNVVANRTFAVLFQATKN